MNSFLKASAFFYFFHIAFLPFRFLLSIGLLRLNQNWLTTPTILTGHQSSSSLFATLYFNMPLIDPVSMSGAKSGQNDWMSKLLGKKLSETSDQVNFAKKDLPQNQ